MRARAPKRPGKVAAPAAKARAKPPRLAPPSTAQKPGKPEVRVFVSYSHVDKEIRRRLETHLAPLKADNVATWFDGDMDAGEKLDTAIARALREAHVFVGLISSDYLASHYCWKIEYRRAMNRRARGTMRVVAVVVRPCDWKSTPAAGFHQVVLPPGRGVVFSTGRGAALSEAPHASSVERRSACRRGDILA